MISDTAPTRLERRERAGGLFTFPNPVNERAARTVAAGVLLLALVTLVLSLTAGANWLCSVCSSRTASSPGSPRADAEPTRPARHSRRCAPVGCAAIGSGPAETVRAGDRRSRHHVRRRADGRRSIRSRSDPACDDHRLRVPRIARGGVRGVPNIRRTDAYRTHPREYLRSVCERQPWCRTACGEVGVVEVRLTARTRPRSSHALMQIAFASK